MPAAIDDALALLEGEQPLQYGGVTCALSGLGAVRTHELDE
jgi:hypothetical protein